MTSLDGDIAPAAVPERELQTLDEPVSTTIYRDLKKVGIKLKYVLIPRDGGEQETLKELRNWDLWGPLMLCLVLSIMLSFTAPEGQTSHVFAAVFVIVWCGAAIVTLNAQLLGGNLSFFQSICVLGYCVFPLTLSSFVCHFWGNVFFRLVVVGVGFVWATRASVVFMAQMVPPERKALAVFPVFLFYVVISWMVVLE
mmetsp:Transcript_3858/g.12243  ORF Transcript_3858/g.12243 Transcript_3858/m.12243 type:complete len:197 (+) Transcript_3858:26-616(+)